MTQWLKQSTAFIFRVGPFLDDTDGKTAETGLTIAQADIQISKNGGAFAQTSASPTTTHDTDGWYQCPLTAIDTGTLGTLDVQIVVAGALPVWRHFTVVPANVYDSLIAGTDYLDAATLTISAGAVDSILDEVVENAVTMRQLLRGFAAVMLGKSANSGADYRDLADSKTRVDATLDANGNRTAVTLDLT